MSGRAPGRDDSPRDVSSEGLDLAGCLERRTAMEGSRHFVTIDGRTLTFAELNELANRVAHGLLDRGVRPGQPVVAYMPNCLELLALWFGAMKIGAIYAPINTEFRGPALAHALRLLEPGILVVDGELLPSLASAGDSLDGLRTLFVRGDREGAASVCPRAEALPFDSLMANDAGNPHRRVDETSLAMLLFTSGTTGRSKACMLSHRFVRRSAELFIENAGLVRDDCLYCPFPLFHADATVYTIMPALVLGCRAAIARRFSASNFWNEIRSTGSTVFDFMGATLTFVWKLPPRPDDLDNPARLAWGVPVPAWRDEFEKRFGLKIATGYGSTDVGVPIWQKPEGERPLESCGRVTGPYDIRIFDGRDREVPPGTTGEIVVRPLEPNVIFDGYYKMPEQTLEASRNLWFHTGDLGRRDEAGNFYFVARKKEAIRRRGENVSAFEIEEVIESHPEIVEVAAHGVPSDDTEEEVKVCVVRAPGSNLTAEDLIGFCEPRMARYMVPRYVEFLAELPRTPTGKIEKFKLAEVGVGDAWDRLRVAVPAGSTRPGPDTSRPGRRES